MTEQQREKEIFRLQCIHADVCRYTCIQVCPYRETTNERDTVLEEAIKKFDNGNYNGQTIKRILSGLRKGEQE